MINRTRLFLVMLLVLVTSISAINATDISSNDTSLDMVNVDTSTNTHITNDDKQIESSTELNTYNNKTIIKKENINTKSKDNTYLILDEPSKKFELQNDVEITGTLTDVDGEELDYEQLKIFVNGVFDGPSATDKYGKFSYLYEPSTVGTYNIYAVYDGTRDYYSSESDKVDFTVISGTDIILNEIPNQILNNSTKITGKIVDKRGNGISNQIITFKDNTGNELGTATSSNQAADIGNFTLDYILKVPGQIEIIASFDGTEYYTNTSKTTTVTISGVLLSLDEPAIPLSIAQPTITGRLITSNQTLATGQKIDIYVNDNYNGFITANANGTFTYTINTTDEIHPITMGNYTVNAITLKNPYPDLISNPINITINNPRTITLDKTTIETKINTLTNITGKLTAADGTIQSGKTINLKNNNETISTTTTGEDGSFTLEVTPTIPQEYVYNVTYESEEEYESNSTSVTLNVSDVPTLTINVLADGIYTAPIINGKLVLFNNTTTALNQRIDIYIDTWYNGKVDSVGEDGTFEYTIDTTNMPAGEHVVTAKTSYSPYPDIESNNITVKYVCGVTIEASPVSNMSIYHPAKITGNVKGQDGSLLSGETLTLYNNDMTMNTTKVNDDGSFTFDFTPTKPGIQKYIVLYKSDYYEGQTTIELNISDVGELIVNNVTDPVIITDATINGTLKSLTGKHISGIQVDVYVNDWFNGKVTTSDEDGTFTYKLNTTSDYKINIGENTIKAKTSGKGNYPDIESNEIIMTIISPTTIKLDETRIDSNNTPVILTKNNTLTKITGNLLDYYENGITKQEIILKQGNETITTALTGDDGKFTIELTPQIIGTNHYTLIYEGNDTYIDTTQNIKLEVTSETTLTIDEIENPAYLNEKINITGKLVDSEGNGVKNQPINIYINNNRIDEATSTSSEAGKEGTFTYETTLDQTGKYNISAEFLGTYHYRLNKSNVIEVVINDKTRIEYEVLNDVEEKAVLVFYVYDSKNNLIKDAKVDLSGDITEKDLATVMVYKNPTLSAGNYTVTIKYNGTEVYNQSTEEITLTIKEDPAKINEELEEQIKAMNQTIQELDDKINELNNKIDELNNTIAKQNNTIDEQNTTINQLNNTIDDLNKTIQEKQDQIKELESIIAQLTAPKETKITIEPITDVKYQDTINITGKLVDNDNRGLPGIINLNINGDNITLEADTSGVYTYEYTATILGEYTVTATYEGTENFTASNTTSTFNVTKQDSNIIFDKIANITSGDNVTITGQLVDGNGKGYYGTVKLTINNGRATVKTDKEGYFNYTTVLSKVGVNNISAAYLESAKYNACNVTTIVNVDAMETKITLDEIAPIKSGENFTIRGKLTDKNGNPIVGTIKFFINNGRATVKTDSNGVFELESSVSKVGTNNITVAYLGANRYTPCEALTTVEVNKMDTVLTLDKISEAKKGQNITIRGKLTDKNGNAVVGTVKLLINNGRATVKTDSNGVFTYNYTVSKVGTNNITATYLGANRYSACNTSAASKVNKAGTKITLNNIGSVTQKTLVDITGQLSDEYGNGIYGTVKLLINSGRATVKTDNTGAFTYSYNATRAGENTIKANYLVSNNYEASESTTTFTVVKA